MELTQEQFNKTIKKIKEEVNKPTSGNCRVGWALKVSVDYKFEKSIHNIEKIANTIIQSGEYIKEPSLQYPGDINILKNPQHKLTIFNKWTVIINIILTTIIIVVSINRCG